VAKRYRAFPSQARGRSGQTHSNAGKFNKQTKSQFQPRLATAQCKSACVIPKTLTNIRLPQNKSRNKNLSVPGLVSWSH